tara:strand:- start:606 stop:863 length:258 start_codon:yes stop_codon:yes gene_type:complete
MIQTYEEFIDADTRAEGLTIPFDDVYAILDENGGEVEEHCFRLRDNLDERGSYKDRLEHTLDLLKRHKWLLYLDKYGNIYSGVIM